MTISFYNKLSSEEVSVHDLSKMWKEVQTISPKLSSIRNRLLKERDAEGVEIINLLAKRSFVIKDSRPTLQSLAQRIEGVRRDIRTHDDEIDKKEIVHDFCSFEASLLKKSFDAKGIQGLLANLREWEAIGRKPETQKEIARLFFEQVDPKIVKEALKKEFQSAWRNNSDTAKTDLLKSLDLLEEGHFIFPEDKEKIFVEICQLQVQEKQKLFSGLEDDLKPMILDDHSFAKNIDCLAFDQKGNVRLASSLQRVQRLKAHLALDRKNQKEIVDQFISLEKAITTNDRNELFTAIDQEFRHFKDFEGWPTLAAYLIDQIANIKNRMAAVTPPSLKDLFEQEKDFKIDLVDYIVLQQQSELFQKSINPEQRTYVLEKDLSMSKKEVLAKDLSMSKKEIVDWINKIQEVFHNNQNDELQKLIKVFNEFSDTIEKKSKERLLNGLIHGIEKGYWTRQEALEALQHYRKDADGKATQQYAKFDQFLNQRTDSSIEVKKIEGSKIIDVSEKEPTFFEQICKRIATFWKELDFFRVWGFIKDTSLENLKAIEERKEKNRPLKEAIYRLSTLPDFADDKSLKEAQYPWEKYTEMHGGVIIDTKPFTINHV